MLTIYKASAGSGKTFTLAYRYIKLLLGVKTEGGDRYMLNMRKYLGGRPVERRPHSHILAITFTNKATAEMKSRIIAELDALARIPADGAPDTPYAAMLTADFGCSRQDLAEVASRSLAGLLHDYGAFNVSTIDSFFQTILRTFAREVERQGDFRLELDNVYVIGAAMSMLFDDLNDGSVTPNRAVSRWLEGMSTERALDGDDYNPFNRGGSMYRALLSGLKKTFNEDFEARAAEVHEYMSDPSRLERLGKALAGQIDDIKRREKRLSADAVAELEAMGLGTGRLKSLGEAIACAASDGLQDRHAEVLSSPAPKQKYMQSVKARDYNAEALFTVGNRKKDPQAGEAACDVVYRWVDGILSLYARRTAMQCVIDSRDNLWALTYISDYINRFRQENNLVLLSDTNSLLRTIISEDETPFIYERVGLELRHFLIDEFQDTSRMQWDNLKPLVANSLAQMHDNLIIGDVKQSIYRWRGGDPTLLASRVADSDFAGHNEVRGELPGENTNYRSAHDIVRFNNTLFARIAADRHIAGYEGITQALADKTAPLTAHIVISDLTADNVAKSAGSYLTPGQIERMTQAGIELNDRNIALERCAAAIIDQHERGYRWGDIVILCRRNRPDATSVVEYMMTHHPEIKIMSDEALLVRNSGAVKLIVSMLEIIDKAWSGQEAVEAAQAADEPARHRPRRDRSIMIDRFEYFAAHGSSVEQALEMALDPTIAAADNGSGSLADDLLAIREQAPANLTALVEAIIERKLTPAQRAADLAYITAFVDLVIDYCNNYNPSLHSFIDYWTAHRDTATIGSGADQDAVTVMTVHKAKGLEWPCVHIPLMDWNLVSPPKSQWFTLDGLDEIPAELRPPLIYMKISGAATANLLSHDGSPVADQIRSRIESETEDNLNVAYVAFTRAVRELHISMTGKTDAGRLRSAVSSTMQSPGTLTGGLYIDLKAHTDSLGNLSIGAPTTPVMKKKTSDGNLPGPEYAVAFTTLNSRLTRIEDMTVTDASALDPDIGNMPDPMTVDRGDTEQMREAARNGINMHAILSRMTTPDDLDRAIAAETAALREGDAELYRDTLAKAFAAGGSQVAEWFDPDAPRVLTEQPVYLPDRNESFRPDRIVWTRRGTVDIIDYKFTTEVLDSHRTQVRGYASLLTSMGHTGVRAYLWYPAMQRIIEVVG